MVTDPKPPSLDWARRAVAALAAAPSVAATAPIRVESGATSRPPAGFTLGEAMGLTAGFAALAQLVREGR